jgi:hypothetical protein
MAWWYCAGLFSASLATLAKKSKEEVVFQCTKMKIQVGVLA